MKEFPNPETLLVELPYCHGLEKKKESVAVYMHGANSTHLSRQRIRRKREAVVQLANIYRQGYCSHRPSTRSLRIVRNDLLEEYTLLR